MVSAGFGFESSAALADFNAGVRVGVSTTDNVFLEPDDQAVDDVFYQVNPFLRWEKETPTFDALVDYRYSRFDYRDSGLDEDWHFLNSFVTGKAMNESLKLTLGADRRQVLRDPLSFILPEQSALAENLISINQWYVEPSFEQLYGASTLLSLVYRYTESRYDSDLIQRQDDTQDARFRLNNYAAGRGVTWALSYDFIRTDYELSLPFEYQNVGGQLGFWAGSNIRVFAGGGLESQWDDLEDRSPQDGYWEAGFAYQAGDSLQAEFAAGERSFGDSWRGSLNYDFRRGSTSLRYIQQPTTEGFNRRRNADFINPEDPDDFLTDPGLAERYIAERFDWDMTIEGRRTNFRLAVFSEDRTQRFSAQGDVLADQSQRGVTARLTWQAGTRTELVLNGTFVNRELDTLTQDDLIRGIAAVNYDLGVRTTLTLSHTYTDQEPGEAGTTRPYTANISTLLIQFSLR